MLAATLLVLSPRFFAEAFFNGKDIVFMTLFALAVHTLTRLVARPTWGRAAWHGVVTAAAIDVRLLAVILLPYTIGLLLLVATQPGSKRTPARAAGVYLLATSVASVVGWPYLWADPISNFLAAFQNLKHYPWRFTNLYMGQLLTVTELPWHYIPVWIFITTPLPYSLLAVGGQYIVGRQLADGGWRNVGTPSNRLSLLVMGWLLGPLVVVIVLHSSVYDTWRHLYFVYPALVLLATRGTQLLASWYSTPQPTLVQRLALLLLVVAGLETGRTAVRMVRMHPYEHLYYSFLSADTIEQKFERDYRALSFRQGLEWLLAHDHSQRIDVSIKWPSIHALYNNELILPAAERTRIVYVPHPQRGHYFITNYRWHPQPYADSVGREIYTIRADGLKILPIFEQHPTQGP